MLSKHKMATSAMRRWALYPSRSFPKSLSLLFFPMTTPMISLTNRPLSRMCVAAGGKSRSLRACYGQISICSFPSHSISSHVLQHGSPVPVTDPSKYVWISGTPLGTGMSTPTGSVRTRWSQSCVSFFQWYIAGRAWNCIRILGHPFPHFYHIPHLSNRHRVFETYNSHAVMHTSPEKASPSNQPT